METSTNNDVNEQLLTAINRSDGDRDGPQELKQELRIEEEKTVPTKTGEERRERIIQL